MQSGLIAGEMGIGDIGYSRWRDCNAYNEILTIDNNGQTLVFAHQWVSALAIKGYLAH